MKICRAMEREAEAMDYWRQYLDACELVHNNFSKPKRISSIVLNAEPANDAFELRCLFSTNKQRREPDLEELARRLTEATEDPPADISDDYLYSIVRRKSLDNGLFALPESIAGQSGHYPCRPARSQSVFRKPAWPSRVRCPACLDRLPKSLELSCRPDAR